MERCSYQGLPALKVTAGDGSSALITEYGGHVVSWIDAAGQERLYVSEKSAFGAGQPIRGGIPVVFPQFAQRGELPRHGFARTAGWHLVHSELDGARASATLRLADDAQTRALWPVSFAVTIAVTIEPSSLEITLLVDNQDREPFSFTGALHTYLAVGAIEKVRLDGLGGVLYSDNAAAGNLIVRDEAETLRIEGEVDRVYIGSPPLLLLRDGDRRLEILRKGFPDVVVWNPWREKCGALADMPPAGFTRMLCVEAAVVVQPVTLAPGEKWSGTQRLSVLS